jgi:hypothetical protein
MTNSPKDSALHSHGMRCENLTALVATKLRSPLLFDPRQTIEREVWGVCVGGGGKKLTICA